MPSKSFTYLALGDSYTIGEGVAIYESFPYQAVQQLRKSGHGFHSPEIIARTGWTTSDLKKGIRNTIFEPSYDFVSLLIGVNDQYQGLDIHEYASNFEILLRQAISFANDKPDRVMVLPVPDWSTTPFAAGRNKEIIQQEISRYNIINAEISARFKVCYINVSEATTDAAMFADDQLHPSAKEYARWAISVAAEIQKRIA